MEKLDLNKILDRESISDKIKKHLLDFEKNRMDATKKRGFYIYGAPGVGKSIFVKLKVDLSERSSFAD